MRKPGWSVAGLALLSALLAGCVTINIYFPAAAAEEAARTIVRDILMTPDAIPGPIPETPESEGAPETGSLQTPPRQVLAAPVLAWMLDRLVPPAAAQSPDLQIQTAAIQRIRASMRERVSQLAPHFRSGVIGFGNNGDVAVRDLSAVALRERSALQRLVSEENADRDALYREIARANDRPEWERQIRETFARVWVEEARAGDWYQDRGGQWRQK